MRATILTLLLLISGAIYCKAQTTNEQGLILVGQPSIFWHNGEWQTYKDGKWTRYVPPRPPELVKERQAQEYMPPFPPEPGYEETAQMPPYPEPYYDPGYYPGSVVIVGPGTYGYGGRTHSHAHRPRPQGGWNGAHAPVQGQTQLSPQRNATIGQTTIGIGQPTIGIGRPMSFSAQR